MRLEMKGISKSFGAVKALKNVDFSLSEGEVHGLLGENGAGKTTLMNILSGAIALDEGKIIIDGKEISEMSPRKSSSMGIRFIHQELSLCNDLKVYQNMFLGEEKKKGLFVDSESERKRAEEVLESMNLNIDPDKYVSQLETAEKQLVEIARALIFDSELIIMDEPTTALSPKEISELFKIMRFLKEKGVSFIYISHKMPEIFEICDKYTVLRDGEFIQTGLISEIDQNKATELLIGKSFVSQDVKDKYKSNISEEVVLDVDNISSSTFHDISFKVRKGEVLVITGLQGSGIDELATALFGASAIEKGEIRTKKGLISSKSIRSSMRKGVGMIPRNRKERAIIADLSISKNASLAYYTALDRKLFISKKEELDRFDKIRESLDVKAASPEDPITSLSGGNQQKVILGKWLSIDCDLYIMDNPTQGIDVGAKYAIYNLINRLAEEGKAILVFTNEYSEMIRVADRAIILYKGRIAHELERNSMSEKLVMAYSTGSSK